MPGCAKHGVEPPQRAAIRLEVRVGWQVEKGVVSWMIGREDDLLSNGSQAFQDALDERAALPPERSARDSMEALYRNGGH